MPNPPKTKPKSFDRTPYESLLAKPWTGAYGEGVDVTEGKGRNKPANIHDSMVNSFGNKLISGTPGGLDAAYVTKNNKLLLSHPSGMGYVDVGDYNPDGTTKTAITQPIVQPIVKNNTPNPADVIRKPIEFGTAGTYNPNTGLNIDYNNKVIEPIVEQYKNGGKVKKMPKYANGGDVNSEEFKTYEETNPLLSSAASTGANAIVPGAGTAVGLGLQGLDAASNYLTQVDPETGKYKDKNKAYASELLNTGVKKLGPFGMIQTAFDKDKTVGEKALSIGTGGISDLFTIKDKVDSNQAYNTGLIDKAKQKQENDKKAALGQISLSQQLTERQNGYKNGGTIKGKGTGKSDSITAKIEKDSFVIPSENSDKAETIRKVVLKAPVKKANLNQDGGTKVKLSNGEHLFTPKEVEKIENKLGDDVLDKLAPNSAKKEDIKEGEKKELPGDKEQLRRQKEALGLKDGGSLADALKAGNKGTNTSAKTKAYPKPKGSNKVNREVVTPDYLQTNTMKLPTNSGDVNIDTQEIITPSEQIGYNNSPSTASGLGLDIGKIGDVAMGAIPFAQTAFGLSQLKKQGKRPVDSLDEDYLKSIDSARGNLQLANADAKFGFTPEEQAMINNENQNLTNAQRYSARNLSGGSAANAYNLERGAINNAFDRALKTRVQNKALMMEKQGIARDQQKYIDELVANKANMNRRLFGDKANAWQQNQESGATLLGSGISNIIGLKRYQDELAAMKNTQGIRNSTYNSLGQ